ncbi:MAG: metal ABC transporter substrate-binding protein [Myxococcota bacterium]
MPSTAAAELEVVTTVTDLAALTQEVGGERVSVISLSLPTQDTHWVDAKPSMAIKVNKADLLVAVGAELEVGWLPTLQQGARNPRVMRSGAGFLECSSHVTLREVQTNRIDRSMGDIHAAGNPHYLYDPRAALRCARAIAAKLAALDPGGKQQYQDNLIRFARRLEAKRQDWEKRLAPYRGAKLVTYHRSWIYLTEWLGLSTIAHLEPKPGVPPSPGHVARVIGQARQQGVKIVLQETYYPSRTGTLVAEKIGARLLVLPAATDLRRGESYIDHMEQVVSKLEAALKG